MPKIHRNHGEMKQFDDPDYNDVFKEITHINDYTVNVRMPDNSVWTIIRDINYNRPPLIFRNCFAVYPFCGNDWSPALTSTKALLMAYAL